MSFFVLSVHVKERETEQFNRLVLKKGWRNLPTLKSKRDLGFG